MRAITVADRNRAAVGEVETPTPGPGEIRVRVRAAALNRADLLVLAGHQHGAVGGAGAIVGLECAGEVESLGEGVRDFAVGDRVMCSARHALAEYATTDAGRAIRIADGTSFERAATLPVALQTMHNAIVTAGRLKKGESVLVQGASSGVGLMALQIAKYMGAGLVIGTSTNVERRARLKEFGADLALDSRDANWVEEARAATGGKGVDLIVDQISGYVANANMQAAAVLGRIVNVGRLGGMKGEFDFDLHALKRIDYIGVTFRTRSAQEVRDIVRLMRADLMGGVESGALGLPIDKVYSFAEADVAFAHMRANAHFGKIVLTL
ncbi:MAG: zinc-binding dehydrogenase [Methylobacteriaceae bacterium]|nr:zinc-binding dehydrogenase [Rhodoblastus sp.]MCC0004256.1 zinc-binding dehydrogenase [Methylobacteriaceae bacterium]